MPIAINVQVTISTWMVAPPLSDDVTPEEWATETMWARLEAAGLADKAEVAAIETENINKEEI